VAAVAVPTAFDVDVLPRDHAAEYGAALFPRMNLLEGVIGAAAVLLSAFLGRAGWGTARRHLAATSLVLGMTLLVIVFLLFLTPSIVDSIQRLHTDGIDLNDTSRMTPERERMGVLHRVYVGLDLAKITAGFVVLWLLASRRSR
jgi:predicted PurR-regulated permease PerM